MRDATYKNNPATVYILMFQLGRLSVTCWTSHELWNIFQHVSITLLTAFTPGDKLMVRKQTVLSLNIFFYPCLSTSLTAYKRHINIQLFSSSLLLTDCQSWPVPVLSSRFSIKCQHLMFTDSLWSFAARWFTLQIFPHFNSLSLHTKIWVRVFQQRVFELSGYCTAL